MKNHITLAILAATICSGAQAWTTEKHTDSFTGKTSLIHTSTSTNSLRLSFPYSGKNHGRMTVVTPTEGEPMVFLEIDKGQIVCPPSYCAIAVKFGRKEPRNFVVVESDIPGDPTYVRFSYAPAILEELAAEPSFVVRFTAFQDGPVDLTFKNKTTLKPAP